MKFLRVAVPLALAAAALLAWLLWPAPLPQPAEVQAGGAAAALPPPTPEAPDAGPAFARLAGQVGPADAGAGAQVTLKGPEPRVVEADPSGHFDFGPLPPGEAWVSAVKGALASEVVGPLYLSPGVSREVTLTLAPASSVSGTVVDALTREPLPGAAIVSGQGASRTDAAGRFTLAPVPRQAWLEVSAKGYLTRLEWLSLESVRQHEGLEISLEPTAVLEGQVLQQAKPVERASVWAELGTGSRTGTLYGPTPSGPDGGFHLETSGGLFRLQAALPDGTPVQGPVLRVAAGERRTGLVLEAGESLGIDGHVRREGQPLVSAVVTAVDARTLSLASTAVTSAQGAFHLARVPVGQYLVQVRLGAFAAQAGPFEQTGEGTGWEVELGQGGNLTGRVEPAAAGVQVWLRTGAWAGPAVQTATDEKGQFRFEGVPAGVLQLEAEGEAGSAAARAKAGDEVVLTLEKGLLVVTVADERGEAVGDYVLSLVPHSAGLVRRLPVLSPTGAFPVHLPKGSWRLSVSAEGFADSSPQELSVGPGRTDARVVLTRAGPVKGSVHDAVTGLPIRGAKVSSTRRGMMRLEGPGAQTVTDGNGDFVIPALPLPAVVQVRDELHEPGWADVTRPDQPLDFRLKPGTPPPPRDQFYEYQGIGMLLGVQAGRVMVQEVYEGSPAEAAGLRPGDALLSVDGRAAGPPPENVVKLIQGPAGTLVNIQVQRGGETIDFVVRRKQIAL